MLSQLYIIIAIIALDLGGKYLFKIDTISPLFDPLKDPSWALTMKSLSLIDMHIKFG